MIIISALFKIAFQSVIFFFIWIKIIVLCIICRCKFGSNEDIICMPHATVVGMSLSEPHINHGNGSLSGMMSWTCKFTSVCHIPWFLKIRLVFTHWSALHYIHAHVCEADKHPRNKQHEMVTTDSGHTRTPTVIIYNVPWRLFIKTDTKQINR